jgi:hypothetical protein
VHVGVAQHSADHSSNMAFFTGRKHPVNHRSMSAEAQTGGSTTMSVLPLRRVADGAATSSTAARRSKPPLQPPPIAAQSRPDRVEESMEELTSPEQVDESSQRPPSEASSFRWPLTYLCPPTAPPPTSPIVPNVEQIAPESDRRSGRNSSSTAPLANITFLRIVHPYHEGNRSALGSVEYQAAERRYHDTLRVNGSRCFAEYRGVDYNSGRANDLAQLRGVTLGFCLHMCLQRNALVHRSHVVLERPEIELDDAAADRLCSGVAFYNWTGICWLKKRLSGADVNGGMTSQHFMPITDVASNETLDFGFAGIAADFGDDPSAPSRHLIQKRVTDTNVYVLGGTQRMTLVDGRVHPARGHHSPHAPPFLSLQPRIHRRRRTPAVNITSILYGVLSEHHYVASRMIPALKTWLRDEDVVVLLVESADRDLHAASERLLAPYLQGYRITPKTVRMVAYLRRNTLRDMQRPADMSPRDFDVPRAVPNIPPSERKRRVLITSAEQMRHEKLLKSLNVPVLQSKKAKEQLEARINAVMDRRSMIQRRQVDQGEFRLADDSGAWKDLPGIDLIFSHFKNFSYYMMIDDDAYIIQHNLRILLNSFYIQHSHPWKTSIYTGVLSVWYQPIDASRATMTPFIQGGAGILMTNKAMSRVFPLVNRCRFACDYLPHGDVRLGCCMKKVVGVSPTYETTFWHMHIYRAQGRDGRPYRSMFPVSFHRMKNESMMMEIDRCVADDIARLNAGGFPLAAPVRWSSLEECYRWMRNTTEHEYKFQMEGLH